MAEKLPEEMAQFIAENQYMKSAVEMAELFNEHFGTDYMTAAKIKTFRHNHHLNSGRTGRFEKGHIPVNRGTKGLKYPGSEKGWFKKGNVPVNHRPVGSERISVDGYIEIKVAEPNKWKLKHRVVYEEKYGKIPDGHVLIFLDRNPLNCTLDNLILAPRSVLSVVNKTGNLTQYPAINESSILVEMVKDKVRKRRKSNNETEREV